MGGEFWYPVVAIIVVAVVTLVLRAFPFIIFGKRKLPEKIKYLSKVLPFAIMTILVIYCLRNTNFKSAPFGLIEIGAVIIVVVLQCLKKNMYLSIIVGTAFYMVMIRVIA